MNTTYFMNLASGNLFGTKTTPPIPTKYYVGLSTTTPNLDGSGVTEPDSTGAYKRIQLTSLSEPTNGTVTNTSSISFDESTSDWGIVTHYVIYDSATNGNLLMFGAFSKPRSIETSTVMTIKEGYLKLKALNPA